MPEQPISTYSVVAIDKKSGEMGVAVQSHWFSVGSVVTWAEAGVGVVATQAFAEVSYGPLGLALLKITAKAKARPMAGRSGNNSGPSPATASLWIVNPFSGSSLVELFSTHPSTQHRIERLRAIARQMGVWVP